jgi:TetR/AcrR family transcriptional repressor of lmrAB and yxaGH operons
MIEVALSLLQKQGYAATSWRELVKEGGTPWGSNYHFFPGGKEELATEALAFYQKKFKENFEVISANNPRPGDMVKSWFDITATEFEGLNYQAGCPVAGVAINTVPMSDSLSAVCLETMEKWTFYLAQKFTTDRIDQDRALFLAKIVLICFEGALITSRISQSAEGLRMTGEFLAKLLNDDDHLAK